MQICSQVCKLVLKRVGNWNGDLAILRECAKTSSVIQNKQRIRTILFILGALIIPPSVCTATLDYIQHIHRSSHACDVNQVLTLMFPLSLLLSYSLFCCWEQWL